jgi:geranylgeranyl reductase family protein
MKKKWKLIVVGAGTAGCVAAYTACRAELEDVLIVEQKPKEKIGDKICGDGIGSNHLEFLHSIGINWDQKEVELQRTSWAHLLSPNMATIEKIPIDGQLTMIQRHEFGQTLLKAAISSGATLLDHTGVKTWKRDEKKKSITLNCKSTTGEDFEVSASLIIDASGIHSPFRNSEREFGELGKLSDDEYYLCYREIWELEEIPFDWGDSMVFHFNNDLTKGGYIWYFHQGKKQFNIGVGVPVKCMKSSPPKRLLKQNILPHFKLKTRIHNGGGFVPTRHPMASYVKDNLILTGDAGLLVNPLHGGGLGSSIASGYFAGQIAADQIPLHKCRESDLWNYNIRLYKKYGKRFAILDFYRILLQQISDEDLNYAITQGLLPLGKIFFTRDYRLLIRLSKTLNEVWMKSKFPYWNEIWQNILKMKELLKRYPKISDLTSTNEIEKWAFEYEKIYQDYSNYLKNSRTDDDR